MPTVFITGAAQGIGKGLVDFFLSKNYNVIAADIQFENEEVSESLLKIRLDVRSPEQWQSSLHRVVEKFGTIDILINNAGVIHPEFVDELSIKSIDNQLDVNLKGVLYGSKFGTDQFKKQGFGHLINVSSLAGVAPIQGLPIYTATKFAVRGFTLSIAKDAKQHSINVSVICPDLVATNMLTEQLQFEAADITFSGNRVLEVQEIVEAIWQRAVLRKEVEVLIPKSRGILAKIGNFFPRIADLLTTAMQQKGRKARLKMKNNEQK